MEMGGKIYMVVLVMILMVGVLIEGSIGLSLCGMDEDGLSACKPSVTKPDPVEPSAECCQALTGADLECLCSYKNSLMLPSLGIDPDLAMALPTKCNLTPPSEC